MGRTYFFLQISHKNWIYYEFSQKSLFGKNRKCKFLRVIITWIVVPRCTKCTAHSWEGVISRKFIQRRNMSCCLKCKICQGITSASVLLYWQNLHPDYGAFPPHQPMHVTTSGACFWIKMPDHSWIAQKFQRVVRQQINIKQTNKYSSKVLQAVNVPKATKSVCSC